MSADGVDAESTPDGRLPSLRALQEGVLTLLYLTLLVGGLTVLVTIELLLRL